MGIPCEGPAFIYGDNQSVLANMASDAENQMYTTINLETIRVIDATTTTFCCCVLSGEESLQDQSLAVSTASDYY